MMSIPDISDADIAFGNIKHMPKYDTLPVDFRRHNGNDFCKAITTWFFGGAEAASNGLKIGNAVFTAKPGVDKSKALAAIRAVMTSWEPKHEHKEAACAFMLSEWFDRSTDEAAA